MPFIRHSAVLNAIMLASLVAVIAGPIRRFMPWWSPGYIVGASFLIAFEAGVIHQTFRREHMWMSELLRFLVPEIVVMFVLMRIATTLSFGVATLAEDARRWLYDPLSIFDAPFIVAILAGLLIGWLAHAAMQNAVELAPHQFETPAQSDETRLAAIVTEERAAALARVNTRFIVGGALLLLCLALEAVNIQNIGAASLPLSALSAIGALCYLISGFLLYSQARLSLLHARWQLDGARVSAQVTRRWSRTSWLIICGVALAALALPRAYGLGLLDTIRAVLNVFGYIFAVLGYAVVSFFGLLLLIPAWLMSLFTAEGAATPPVREPLPPLPPPPPEVANEPRLWTALIFWMCMMFLIGYALWIVAQRHPGVWQAVTSRSPLASLLRWFRALWGDTRVWVGQAAQVAQSRLRRPPRVQAQRALWLRLSRLAPRELIRYFYRSTLQRAATHGLTRRPGETPYEYSATLTNALPDAQPDIAELTDSFVTAQYSPKPIDTEAVRRARGSWERMRRALRKASERF
jgi:hypothetical protein